MTNQGPAARVNALGQPIGESVGAWAPPDGPRRTAIEGRTCRLEPLDPAGESSRRS